MQEHFPFRHKDGQDAGDGPAGGAMKDVFFGDLGLEVFLGPLIPAPLPALHIPTKKHQKFHHSMLKQCEMEMLRVVVFCKTDGNNKATYSTRVKTPLLTSFLLHDMITDKACSKCNHQLIFIEEVPKGNVSSTRYSVLSSFNSKAEYHRIVDYPGRVGQAAEDAPRVM